MCLQIGKKHYNRLIKDTVRQHYQDELQSNSGNLKKTWKTINELINKSRKDSKIQELKNEEGEIINPTDIPNTFNQYFTDWENNYLTIYLTQIQLQKVTLRRFTAQVAHYFALKRSRNWKP